MKQRAPVFCSVSFNRNRRAMKLNCRFLEISTKTRFFFGNSSNHKKPDALFILSFSLWILHKQWNSLHKLMIALLLRIKISHLSTFGHSFHAGIASREKKPCSYAAYHTILPYNVMIYVQTYSNPSEWFRWNLARNCFI